MTQLITGGAGFIGSELARQLVARGERVVIFDLVIDAQRIADIADKVAIVQGDLGNFSHVLGAVKEHKVEVIYHFGSMLSARSEQDPASAFSANVMGTYHVLEAARLFGVRQVMFASSVGTYGLGAAETITDDTIQRPVTFYGCAKLYGEGLGRWYARKYGLDFRSLRYAQMVGPGVRTSWHWAPAMIEDAIQGRPHESTEGNPDATVSMIYISDAARAADLMMQAPRERIQTMNYLVMGDGRIITACELEAYLKTRYPGTVITYRNPGTGRPPAIQRYDDRRAREEWDWRPQYDSTESIVTAFESDVKRQAGADAGNGNNTRKGI